MIPVVAVRLRRDFALVRSLVFAHAILHQTSRPRDEKGRVVATLVDYQAVRALIGEIVSQGIGATVSDDIRETVAAVQAALKADPEAATVKRVQVQAKLGLDDRAGVCSGADRRQDRLRPFATHRLGMPHRTWRRIP